MLDRRYSRSENTSPSAHASELEVSTEISTSLSSLDKDQENQDVENEEFTILFKSRVRVMVLSHFLFSDQ